jgi:hypothetical protein
MTKVKKGTPAKLVCEECGRADFISAAGLGSHRRSAHGVMGTAPSTLAAREARIVTTKGAKAKNGSNATQPRKSHHKASEKLQPTLEPQAVVSIPPQILGYGVGKLESLAEEIAQQNDLPAREFLTRCAQALLVLAKH